MCQSRSLVYIEFGEEDEFDWFFGVRVGVGVGVHDGGVGGVGVGVVVDGGLVCLFLVFREERTVRFILSMKR